jgi:crotonobetainyl-CoA:carnitine CoA-transferase CaiB-like acyl-CoA transferase
VLDLGDRPGAFAAKLLGDLGADVVKVEPPAGDPLRDVGPFWRDEPDPDRSLAFWFYNTSKRSTVLDLTRAADRDVFHRLLAGADVAIVAGTPEELARRGLVYDDIGRPYPRLVVVAITPFGLDGPRAAWRTSALVAEAVSGMLYVNGFPGQAPIATVGTQAYHATGAFAAIAALAAVIARARTGRGQLIDVSIQEATAAAVEHVAAFFHQTGRVHRRMGSLHWTRHFRAAKCRDGYVLHCSLGDWTSLLEWVRAEGAAQDLGEPAWEDFNHRRVNCLHLFDVLDDWAKAHTVAEVMDGAQLRRIPYATVRSPAALRDDPQLAEREFFVPVEHPDLATAVLHPRGPCHMSETPWTVQRHPPRLGKHTTEVLHGGRVATHPWQDAGNSQGNDVASRKDRESTTSLPRTEDIAGRSTAAEREQASLPRCRPLDGIRILDFTWVVAGPAATRLLADLGADVIKIERGDALDFGSRRGGFTGSLNRGKRSVVIDLADPRGLDLARRLVATADVVIDNFSARVMRNWTLDYDGLRAIKDDIIAISMSGFGQSGPYRDYVSYGPTLQALAGYTLLMRQPEGDPAGFGFSYADIVGGYTAALAVLAALWHHRRTGRGQAIDLSQFEASCAVLGPMLLDVIARGGDVKPPGNTSQEGPAAPHGVYRCRGEDRWCAIAVLSDHEWERFVAALDRPLWATDPRFARLADRLRHNADLDAKIGAWTGQHTAEEIVDRLQEAGVRAGVVADAEDLCLRDPHLQARKYWVRTRTPEGSEVILDGIPYRFTRTPAFVNGAGPLLGEHTSEVLKELLGLDQAEIATLRAGGVVK